MNFKKITLLAAMALTASIFAQENEEFSTASEEVTPVSSYSAPVASSSNDNGTKGIKFRISGDMTIRPGWDIDNNYEYEDIYDDGDLMEDVKVDSKAKTFNMKYGWNVNFGLDINENLSFDFRLSNPEGYALGQLNFANGSTDGYDIFLNHLPRLPHAYFTWRAGKVFSLQGGLLEVKDNTVLDLVSGYESDLGMWTNNYNWGKIYNNSQAGLKFIFNFTDNFEMKLTTALVSPYNTIAGGDYWNNINYMLDYDDYIDHNEFRFILEADIALNDVVTISPVLQTRSFWKQGYYDEDINGDTDGSEDRTPILFAYGTDVELAFGDMFNLDLGIAMGNITWEKSKYESSVSGFGSVKMEDKESDFGFLFKVAPTLNLGKSEVYLGYSLGVLSEKYKQKADVSIVDLGKGDIKGSDKYKSIYNDLNLGYLFHINKNVAFGPYIEMAFRSDKESGKYDINGSQELKDAISYELGMDIDDLYSDYDDKIGGYNHVRFGIDFKVNF